jgi:hypothetical protein
MAEPATDVATAAPAPGRNQARYRRRPGLASSTLCESAEEQGDLRERARIPTRCDLRGSSKRPGTAGERGGKVGGKAAF